MIVSRSRDKEAYLKAAYNNVSQSMALPDWNPLRLCVPWTVPPRPCSISVFVKNLIYYRNYRKVCWEQCYLWAQCGFTVKHTESVKLHSTNAGLTFPLIMCLRTGSSRDRRRSVFGLSVLMFVHHSICTFLLNTISQEHLEVISLNGPQLPLGSQPHQNVYAFGV